MKNIKSFVSFYKVNESREKVLLGGYEQWVDKEKQVVYDSEFSKNGIPYDILYGTQISSSTMNKDEKEDLKNYLNLKPL